MSNFSEEDKASTSNSVGNVSDLGSSYKATTPKPLNSSLINFWNSPHKCGASACFDVTIGSERSFTKSLLHESKNSENSSTGSLLPKAADDLVPNKFWNTPHQSGTTVSFNESSGSERTSKPSGIEMDLSTFAKIQNENSLDTEGNANSPRKISMTDASFASPNRSSATAVTPNRSLLSAATPDQTSRATLAFGHNKHTPLSPISQYFLIFQSPDSNTDNATDTNDMVSNASQREIPDEERRKEMTDASTKTCRSPSRDSASVLGQKSPTRVPQRASTATSGNEVSAKDSSMEIQGRAMRGRTSTRSNIEGFTNDTFFKEIESSVMHKKSRDNTQRELESSFSMANKSGIDSGPSNCSVSAACTSTAKLAAMTLPVEENTSCYDFSNGEGNSIRFVTAMPPALSSLRGSSYSPIRKSGGHKSISVSPASASVRAILKTQASPGAMSSSTSADENDPRKILFDGSSLNQRSNNVPGVSNLCSAGLNISTESRGTNSTSTMLSEAEVDHSTNRKVQEQSPLTNGVCNASSPQKSIISKSSPSHSFVSGAFRAREAFTTKTVSQSSSCTLVDSNGVDVIAKTFLHSREDFRLHPEKTANGRSRNSLESKIPLMDSHTIAMESMKGRRWSSNDDSCSDLMKNAFARNQTRSHGSCSLTNSILSSDCSSHVDSNLDNTSTELSGSVSKADSANETSLESHGSVMSRSRASVLVSRKECANDNFQATKFNATRQRLGRGRLSVRRRLKSVNDISMSGSSHNINRSSVGTEQAMSSRNDGIRDERITSATFSNAVKLLNHAASAAANTSSYYSTGEGTVTSCDDSEFHETNERVLEKSSNNTRSSCLVLEGRKMGSPQREIQLATFQDLPPRPSPRRRQHCVEDFFNEGHRKHTHVADRPFSLEHHTPTDLDLTSIHSEDSDGTSIGDRHHVVSLNNDHSLNASAFSAASELSQDDRRSSMSYDYGSSIEHNRSNDTESMLVNVIDAAQKAVSKVQRENQDKFCHKSAQYETTQSDAFDHTPSQSHMHVTPNRQRRELYCASPMAAANADGVGTYVHTNMETPGKIMMTKDQMDRLKNGKTPLRSNGRVDELMTASPAIRTAPGNKNSAKKMSRQEPRTVMIVSEKLAESFDSSSVSTLDDHSYKEEHEEVFWIDAFLDFVSPVDDDRSVVTYDSSSSFSDRSAVTRKRHRTKKRPQSSFSRLQEWWKKELIAEVMKSAYSEANTSSDAEPGSLEQQALFSNMEKIVSGEFQEFLKASKDTIEEVQKGYKRGIASDTAETLKESYRTLQKEVRSFDTLDGLVQAIKKSKLDKNIIILSGKMRCIYEQLQKGLQGVNAFDNSNEENDTNVEITLSGVSEASGEPVLASNEMSFPEVHVSSYSDIVGGTTRDGSGRKQAEMPFQMIPLDDSLDQIMRDESLSLRPTSTPQELNPESLEDLASAKFEKSAGGDKCYIKRDEPLFKFNEHDITCVQFDKTESVAASKNSQVAGSFYYEEKETAKSTVAFDHLHNNIAEFEIIETDASRNSIQVGISIHDAQHEATSPSFTINDRDEIIADLQDRSGAACKASLENSRQQHKSASISFDNVELNIAEFEMGVARAANSEAVGQSFGQDDASRSGIIADHDIATSECERGVSVIASISSEVDVDVARNFDQVEATGVPGIASISSDVDVSRNFGQVEATGVPFIASTSFEVEVSRNFGQLNATGESGIASISAGVDVSQNFEEVEETRVSGISSTSSEVDVSRNFVQEEATPLISFHEDFGSSVTEFEEMFKFSVSPIKPSTDKRNVTNDTVPDHSLTEDSETISPHLDQAKKMLMDDILTEEPKTAPVRMKKRRFPRIHITTVSQQCPRLEDHRSSEHDGRVADSSNFSCNVDQQTILQAESVKKFAVNLNDSSETNLTKFGEECVLLQIVDPDNIAADTSLTRLDDFKVLEPELDSFSSQLSRCPEDARKVKPDGSSAVMERLSMNVELIHTEQIKTTDEEVCVYSFETHLTQFGEELELSRESSYAGTSVPNSSNAGLSGAFEQQEPEPNKLVPGTSFNEDGANFKQQEADPVSLGRKDYEIWQEFRSNSHFSTRGQKQQEPHQRTFVPGSSVNGDNADHKQKKAEYMSPVRHECETWQEFGSNNLASYERGHYQQKFDLSTLVSSTCFTGENADHKHQKAESMSPVRKECETWQDSASRNAKQEPDTICPIPDTSLNEKNDDLKQQETESMTPACNECKNLQKFGSNIAASNEYEHGKRNSSKLLKRHIRFAFIRSRLRQNNRTKGADINDESALQLKGMTVAEELLLMVKRSPSDKVGLEPKALQDGYLESSHLSRQVVQPEEKTLTQNVIQETKAQQKTILATALSECKAPHPTVTAELLLDDFEASALSTKTLTLQKMTNEPIAPLYSATAKHKRKSRFLSQNRSAPILSRTTGDAVLFANSSRRIAQAKEETVVQDVVLAASAEQETILSNDLSECKALRPTVTAESSFVDFEAPALSTKAPILKMPDEPIAPLHLATGKHKRTNRFLARNRSAPAMSRTTGDTFSLVNVNCPPKEQGEELLQKQLMQTVRQKSLSVKKTTPIKHENQEIGQLMPSVQLRLLSDIEPLAVKHEEPLPPPDNSLEWEDFSSTTFAVGFWNAKVAQTVARITGTSPDHVQLSYTSQRTCFGEQRLDIYTSSNTEFDDFDQNVCV